MRKKAWNGYKNQTRTGTLAVEVANDVSHAGLVAHEGGQVDGLFGVILMGYQRTEERPEVIQTFGKDLTFPRWRAARLRGRKPREP